MLAIDLVGFAIAGVVFPTGSTGQLWFVVGTLVVAPIVAFYLVFDGDPNAFRDSFTR